VRLIDWPAVGHYTDSLRFLVVDPPPRLTGEDNVLTVKLIIVLGEVWKAVADVRVAPAIENLVIRIAVAALRECQLNG
jgi:hypothetical protein